MMMMMMRKYFPMARIPFFVSLDPSCVGQVKKGHRGYKQKRVSCDSSEERKHFRQSFSISEELLRNSKIDFGVVPSLSLSFQIILASVGQQDTNFEYYNS